MGGGRREEEGRKLKRVTRKGYICVFKKGGRREGICRRLRRRLPLGTLLKRRRGERKCFPFLPPSSSFLFPNDRLRFFPQVKGEDEEKEERGRGESRRPWLAAHSSPHSHSRGGRIVNGKKRAAPGGQKSGERPFNFERVEFLRKNAPFFSFSSSMCNSLLLSTFPH